MFHNKNTTALIHLLPYPSFFLCFLFILFLVLGFFKILHQQRGSFITAFRKQPVNAIFVVLITSDKLNITEIYFTYLCHTTMTLTFCSLRQYTEDQKKTCLLVVHFCIAIEIGTFLNLGVGISDSLTNPFSPQGKEVNFPS